MLLLGLGVLFGGESGQWKALVRTIFLDFGQKSGRSAEGMSFDEADCLNRNSKRTALRSRFRSARTLHPLNWSVKSIARKRTRKWGKKCSALRWRVQRAAMTFGARCEAKCSALPCRPLSSSNPNAVHFRFCSFPFLQQNKPFFPSLFTFEAGIRQANAPGACPVLSCFVQRARIIRTCVLQLITCVQRIKPHFVFSFFENLLYLCRNLIFS